MPTMPFNKSSPYCIIRLERLFKSVYDGLLTYEYRHESDGKIRIPFPRQYDIVTLPPAGAFAIIMTHDKSTHQAHYCYLGTSTSECMGLEDLCVVDNLF